jgi:hypothetical protein
MSLAVLKRKTAAKYNNSSVGESQFSLNGTRSNQGYIGQDTRGRYLSRTLMRDGAARGHGGCCGKYETKMLSPGICSLNDASVIKKSSMNNLGQLMTRYKWINSGNGTVKVDSNQDTYSSNSYTVQIRNRKIEEADTCTEPSVKPPACKPDVPMSRNTLGCNITKDITKIEGGPAMDSSLYILGLGKKCTDAFNNPNPVSSIVRGVLPGN